MIFLEFYGTIGPACAQLETLQRMVKAGMTGIRMNLSHGPLSAHKDWLDIIHAVGIPQLLIDLQGPELRIGTLPQPLVLEPGQSLRLGQGGVPCPAALVHAARPGQNLLLDDGRLLVQVAETDGAALQCTVVRGGTLQSRKSLAAPGLTVASPTLTEEDLQNLQLAGACGVTGVMLPFVRGAEDIRTLRRNAAALEQVDIGIGDAAADGLPLADGGVGHLVIRLARDVAHVLQQPVVEIQRAGIVLRRGGGEQAVRRPGKLRAARRAVVGIDPVEGNSDVRVQPAVDRVPVGAHPELRVIEQLCHAGLERVGVAVVDRGVRLAAHRRVQHGGHARVGGAVRRRVRQDGRLHLDLHGRHRRKPCLQTRIKQHARQNENKYQQTQGAPAAAAARRRRRRLCCTQPLRVDVIVIGHKVSSHMDRRKIVSIFLPRMVEIAKSFCYNAPHSRYVSAKEFFIMIEVTFRIESLDYTDKLDSQLPLVLEALSQSGNINPVLKLACNTPEASSRIVKGILRTMSQDQKQRLATKIVNANREKLMRKLNEYAAGKGIDVHICDCAATFR